MLSYANTVKNNELAGKVTFTKTDLNRSREPRLRAFARTCAHAHRSLYHFTMRGLQEDARLATGAAYLPAPSLWQADHHLEAPAL